MYDMIYSIIYNDNVFIYISSGKIFSCKYSGILSYILFYKIFYKEIFA